MPVLGIEADMLRRASISASSSPRCEAGSAEHIYETLYCARGQAENLIKQHKAQLASDRTSCRSPLANQMRLILHTAAYWLLLTCVMQSPRHTRSPQPSSPPFACGS